MSTPCGSDLLGVSALGFAALGVAASWCVLRAMKKRHCAIAGIETRSISVHEKGEIPDFLTMWLKALSHVKLFHLFGGVAKPLMMASAYETHDLKTS